MSALASCLYLGRVVHRRLRPRVHLLSYRVFCLYADLGELAVLNARLRLFAYNRWGVFSFLERDHGSGSREGLRSWLNHHLARAGIDIGDGAVRVLCYPRLLGYVFNPLTVYYCYYYSGELAAVLYEVNNTFGQRHGYLIPVDRSEGGVILQKCAKEFYVSPFIASTGTYRFRLTQPCERLAVAITYGDGEGPLLHASFRGTRAPLDDRTLGTVFLRYPLMTLKVIGGIHLEALRLWRKGVPIAPRTPAPTAPVTIVGLGAP